MNGSGAVDTVYKLDNRHVWKIMADLCRDHKCWTYVKPFQRARNGRGAFLGLRQHYLGPNNINNTASEAKANLNNTKYHGEKKRWNFESYVSLMKEKHQILHQLEEHGHSNMDEGSKVHILNHGIQTDKLNNVKTQILDNPALRNDLDYAARCIKTSFCRLKATAMICSIFHKSKRTIIPGRSSTRIGLGRRARVESTNVMAPTRTMSISRINIIMPMSTEI